MSNDSIFLTGMNSQSVSKLERSKEKAEAKKYNKYEKKTKIAPAIEPVIEELEKEMKETIIKQLDLVDSGVRNFESHALALKLYKKSCENLKSRLSNIMRVTYEVGEPEDG